MELILKQMSASPGFGGKPTSTLTGWGRVGETAQVKLRGIRCFQSVGACEDRRVVNGGSGANASVDLT